MGANEPFEIRLKRGVGENITLPFDATRDITAPQTLQFAGVASPNGVRIIVERSLNSSLDATVTPLDSSGLERATGNLGSAAVTLEVKLIVGVQYALTINPVAVSRVAVCGFAWNAVRSAPIRSSGRNCFRAPPRP